MDIKLPQNSPTSWKTLSDAATLDFIGKDESDAWLTWIFIFIHRGTNKKNKQSKERPVIKSQAK